MSKELRAFTKAMTEKRRRKMKEHPERPADPWNHYPKEVLWRRLQEEFKEWKDVVDFRLKEPPELMEEQEADELLDIANFAFFRWTQIKNK